MGKFTARTSHRFPDWPPCVLRHLCAEARPRFLFLYKLRLFLTNYASSLTHSSIFARRMMWSGLKILAEDAFNLYGLRSVIPHFRECLELILDCASGACARNVRKRFPSTVAAVHLVAGIEKDALLVQALIERNGTVAYTTNARTCMV